MLEIVGPNGDLEWGNAIITAPGGFGLWQECEQESVCKAAEK